jgi:hypothetical protein
VTLVGANAVLKNPSKIDCSNINKTRGFQYQLLRIKKQLFLNTVVVHFRVVHKGPIR